MLIRPAVLLALLPLISSPTSHAQGLEKTNQARPALLQGVGSLPKPGAPGAIALWGPQAQAILAAADARGVQRAVVASSLWGKGRVLLTGHNSLLDGQAGGDHLTLMRNAILWCAGNSKGSRRIGYFGISPKALELLQPKLRLEKIEALSSDTLRQVDVLILNAQGVDQPEAAKAIAEFVQRGGGLIAGMTGWAYPQTSAGRNLATDHALNLALMEAGLAFTEEGGFEAVKSFEGNPAPSALIHAATALQWVAKPTGNPVEMDLAAEQASASIELALGAQGSAASPFRHALELVLNRDASSARNRLPSAEKPLRLPQDLQARLQLQMQCRLLRLPASEERPRPAHPAHVNFPGAVARNVPRVEQAIDLDPRIPGWCSTGLYAAAGESIELEVPQAVVDQGFALRIGCHSDKLYHLKEWQRAPDITVGTPVRSSRTRLSSAFGGLIYVEVPERFAGPPSAIKVTLRGGIPSPRFVLGQHSDEQWLKTLRHQPGPWAELACPRLILSCPSSVAARITNPTQLMEFWDRVVAAQDDIANQGAERRRPERIVADVQISAGYMHSGYPIMIPTSAAPEMVTFSRIKFPGWGFYHEIGHNHQRPSFTFQGAGEVTNNVLGMYCYEAVLGKDWLMGHPAISAEARRENLQRMRQAKDKWALWQSDPFTALHMYIQLIQAFGWQSWRAYLHSFADGSFGAPPRNDAEARDQLLTRYSKIVGENLSEFFEFWGIPLSSAAKAQVQALPRKGSIALP